MGWLPAAIGAQIAVRKTRWSASQARLPFQMNSQEMATAAINRVPLKVVIIDNRALGMVHQWQSLFYDHLPSTVNWMRRTS